MRLNSEDRCERKYLKDVTMPTTSIRTGQFFTLVGLPEFLFPWADRFYEPMEIELIDLLGKDALDVAAVQTRWEAALDSACPQDVDAFLKRSFKRGVLNRNDRLYFSVADFHTRYDIWALFESWQDIPDEVRLAINRWELNDYQAQHRHLIEALRGNRYRDTSERWPEYLLLHEAEALIDAVEHVYLWPCNCRAMMGNCRKPIYTCLRFSNNRDLGWEISKPRAIAIMREANTKGLMQSGEISFLADGSVDGALCNCCSDCCFPHLLAEGLHAEKLWPLTRYQAQVDGVLCNACGRCAARCPFKAITLEKQANEPDNATIRVDAGLCRGCGVCSTGCREEAISMVKLEGVDSLLAMLKTG